MRLGSWNAKGGTLRERAAVGVRAIIKQYKPDVLCLAECRGEALAAVRKKTRVKHRVLAPLEYAWQDGAMVVRRKHKIEDHGVLVHHVPWVGPDNHHWPGKALVWCDIKGVLYIEMHQVWNPHLNKAAAEATLAMVTKKIKAHNGPWRVLGDWNDDRKGVAAFARAHNGHVVVGKRVDHMAVQGGKFRAKVGPAHGSDHDSIIYDEEGGE